VRPRKLIEVMPGIKVGMTEEMVEQLKNEAECALRAWDDERAAELRAMQEDESADFVQD
jgi:hypothetical protein